MGHKSSLEKAQPIAIEYVHQSLNPYETTNDNPQ